MFFYSQTFFKNILWTAEEKFFKKWSWSQGIRMQLDDLRLTGFLASLGFSVNVRMNTRHDIHNKEHPRPPGESWPMCEELSSAVKPKT
jgi:hypothetical protein